MRGNALLIEHSFADAIAMIAAAEELPEEKRRHWATSLRQVAKALDRPLQVIPARYSAVRADLINLHEVPVGLTATPRQEGILQDRMRDYGLIDQTNGVIRVPPGQD
jgi:hypothetical protein